MLFFKKKTITEEKPAEETITAPELPVTAAPEPIEPIDPIEPNEPAEPVTEPETQTEPAPRIRETSATFASEEEHSQIAEILGVTDAELKSEFILTKIKKLTAKIEYTYLKPDATGKELAAVAAETKKYSFGKLCVLPSQVEDVKKLLPDSVNVATIIGYPYGADSYGAALTAVRDAVKAGAREIYFVVNPYKIANDDFYDFRRRIAKLCGASKKRLVAVIEPTQIGQKKLKKLLNLFERVPLAGIRLCGGFYRADAGAQLAAYRDEEKSKIPVTVYTEVATAEELKKLFLEGATTVATNKAAEIALELAAVNHANFD